MRIPRLRGSSSMKPMGAVDRAGLRRSSVATDWPPLPAPTISTSRSADSTSGPRGRSTTARTRKRALTQKASVSRKSSAITPRGGLVSPGDRRNRAAIRTKLDTTTALTSDSKSFWSTNRQSLE